MPPIDFTLILIFFVYGLSFFSMGLAMILESARSPLLAEGRILRPLGIFGLVHGLHEWLEMGLYNAGALGYSLPGWLVYVRLGILVFSFACLWVFGLRVLRPREGLHWQERLALFGLLGVYLAAALLLVLTVRSAHPDWLAHLDAQARYLLAVPGAALAALALFRQAYLARQQGRARIGRLFTWTALGFGLYSATQLLVPRLDVFPASLVNAAAFRESFGFPIQLVRAFLAVGIMLALIRASQVAEEERQQAFLSAQAARLEALEAMQREMGEREKLRRELLRHTVIAQEDERARIARELHDETAQVLTAFSLSLATLRDTLSDDPAVNDLLARLQGLCRQMSQGIYRLVHDLRPAQLDDLGLVAALQHLAEMEQKRVGLNVDLHVEGPRRRLDPLVETVFFRVAQEALTNVARHAGVGRADVHLIFQADRAVVRVCDEGCGFDPSAELVPPHGWGLAGMQERAESVGGFFHLSSRPGRGTVVEVQVPFGEAVRNSGEGKDNGHYSVDAG